MFDDDCDEVVGLIGMFDEMVSRLRMVRDEMMTFDISEGDPEAIGRDDLQKWYEDLEVDRVAFENADEDIARMIKARPGESIIRWSDEHQVWMVKPFELPSSGFTDSEEEAWRYLGHLLNDRAF